jgi:hypothetical protein
MLQCWSLECPLVRRCPSGCIEEVLHYVIVEAAPWSGEAIHSGRPVLPPSSLVLTQPA